MKRVSQRARVQGKPVAAATRRRSRPLLRWRSEGGRRLLVLENASFRVEIWPELGGAIMSYVRKPENLEILWKNPQVQPPRREVLSQPIAGGSDLFDVMDGSWYVSLPNGFFSGEYFGAPVGTHGELRAVPWEVAETSASATEVRAVLVGRSIRTPLVYRRELVVRRDSARMFWRETLQNRCGMDLPVAWLHHPAFSGPVLEGARLIAPARTVSVFQADDPSALQLKSGYVGQWPHVPERVGGRMRDCSVVPAAGSGLDHSIQMTDFAEGWGCFWNEKRQLGFSLTWDLRVFPYAWSWAYGGGPVRYPMWNGGQLITLQPSTSPVGRFAELVKNKMVLTVPARGEVTTEMTTGFVEKPNSPWN